MNKNLLILCVFCIFSFGNATNATLPIVLWHGMGDSCCLPFSLGAVTKMLKHKLDNVYVHSLKIGASMVQDYESGFFTHPNTQVEMACKIIQNDPQLQNGYNAIGFSQGGLFLRAIAQRCPTPSMHTLISFGGPQQGVFGLPNCPSLSRKTCETFRKMLNTAAYTKLMQRFLVQATYWHDPWHEDTYNKYSTFLSDINNENVINKKYITNLQSLKKLVLVKFTNDTIVQPKESEWFEFYAPNQDTFVLPLKESGLYTKNQLGLEEMFNNNQIIFLESDGNHLQFTNEWFDQHIIPILNITTEIQQTK